jgi:hypothetical protein
VLDQVDFEKKFARLPAFRPDDPQRGTISLPSTPSAIMRTMWEKQRVVETDNSSSSPMLTPRTPKPGAATPRTPSNRRESSSSTSSSFFFGPNFNLATANDQVPYPLNIRDNLL